MEGGSEGALRGGAHSTLEAMVVSMGFMVPSVTMFFIDVSVFLYFFRKERENFSVVRHVVTPLVATAAVCLPIYGLIYPFLDPPSNLWPYLMAAWALISLRVLFYKSRNRPEMLEVMGRAFSESGDEPDTAQNVPPAKDRRAGEEPTPGATS